MKRVKVISSSDTQTTHIDSLETDGRVDGFETRGRRGRGGHVRWREGIRRGHGRWHDFGGCGSCGDRWGYNLDHNP